MLCGAPHVVDQPFFVMLRGVILPNATCLKRLKDVHDRYGASVHLRSVPADAVAKRSLSIVHLFAKVFECLYAKPRC